MHHLRAEHDLPHYPPTRALRAPKGQQMRERALALIDYAAWCAEAEHGPNYGPADLHHELKRAATTQRLTYRYSRSLASIIDPETNQSHTITRAELWDRAQSKGNTSDVR